MPDISLIVSTYNDPIALRCCLASLDLQTNQDFEVIVTDNSDSKSSSQSTEDVVYDFGYQYLKTNFQEPYSSAEAGVLLASGNWLGFPSSDGYQTPLYLQAMVETRDRDKLDFVYCDLLYDRRQDGGRYRVMDTRLQLGHIDKTCFLMKKSLFHGFPGKAPISYSDWYLVEELMKDETIRFGKCEECLVVHN